MVQKFVAFFSDQLTRLAPTYLTAALGLLDTFYYSVYAFAENKSLNRHICQSWLVPFILKRWHNYLNIESTIITTIRAALTPPLN